MILAFVGVAAYYVIENGKVLPVSEASALIEQSLRQDGPVTIQFHVGMVTASVQDRPHDPNYQLLEKAGFLKVGNDNGRATLVTMTPVGRKFFADIPEVNQSKDPKDKTESFIVPVARRKLVGTPKVTMTGMGRATVEFTWGWETNKMGELLDASGPMVKGFNTWDRGKLIDKYGAKFYHDPPTKAVVAMVKGDKGWKIAVE
jgi:hypothetical protein